MLSAKQTVFATRSSTLSQSVNLNNMCPPWFDNNHIQGENYGILASILSSPVPRAFTPKAHHLRFVHPRLEKLSSRIITLITIHHHHPLSPLSPSQVCSPMSKNFCHFQSHWIHLFYLFQDHKKIKAFTSSWLPPLPGTRITGCKGEQLMYPGEWSWW